MRGVFGLVLIVGMGLAGFAVYMVKGFLSDQQVALNRERALRANIVLTVDVYSPTRALTPGEFLTADDVRLIKYARDYLPERIFQTQEQLFPSGPDVLRVVTQPMAVNEPITAFKVSDPGAPRGITALLDRGMRAVTVTGAVSGGTGNLRPNDRIDIYWTGTIQGQQITQLIKSSVQIIFIEQGSNRATGQSVVVQVTPTDVATLTQAQQTGRLTLSLVGTGDDTQVGSISVDTRDVLGIEETVVIEAAPVVEDQKCFITKRVGTERIQEEVAC